MEQQSCNRKHCSHSPSAHLSQWQVFWEFVLRKNKLYNRGTNASECARCGKVIQIPIVCREMLPTRVFSVGFWWVLSARFLIGMITSHIDISNPIAFVIWLILGLGIRFVLKRISVAILLASYSWEETTETDAWQLKDAAKSLKEKCLGMEIAGVLAAISVDILYHSLIL